MILKSANLFFLLNIIITIKTKAKEIKLYGTNFQVNMGVFPAQAVVKCDDTTSGIVAGLHAGCWTVGIAKTVISVKIQGV